MAQDEAVEKFLRIRAILSDLEEEGNYQQAIELCDSFLSEWQDIPENLRRVLEWRTTVLRRAVDANYSPPPPTPSEEYEPLRLRSKQALRQGHLDLALSEAWQYMQYLSPGTYGLQRMLSMIAEIALKAGYEQLAKAAARLYIAHLRLMEAAAANPLTPIEPLSTQGEWKPPQVPVREMLFAIPVEVALRFIHEEDDPVWPAILELDLEVGEKMREGVIQVVASLGNIPVSPNTLRTLEALVRHYRRYGYEERLQALLRKYPEASRFLGESG